jgi:hypothetical protein
MTISLRIDQIVIEGAALTRRERAQLASDLENELAALLRQRTGRGGLAAPAATRERAAPGSALATQIAREVLAALPPDTFATGRGRATPSGGRAVSKGAAP